MRTLLIFAALLFSSQSAAQGYQSEIDKFFTLFEQGRKTEAVDAVYATNPWINTASDAVQHVKTQLEGIDKLVGNYNGRVLVDETVVKDRFVHVTYLALYDRQPVRMEFQFYRPKEDWIVYSFSFDVDFDDEIQAGVRAKVAADGR